MPTREYAIAEYALIGNCETAALINLDGGIDWLCLPAFDAPSFFGALLDREKGGTFLIQPQGECRIERRYLEDTAILETRFISERGSVKLTDFFVTARQPSARFYDFCSLHATHKLVRLVEWENGGPVPMRAQLSARPDYGRARPAWHPVKGGSECAETAVFSNLALTENDSKISACTAFERGRDLGLLNKKETNAICQKIRQQVLDRGIREREGLKYLADHYETDATDATALLAFPLGFLPRELACSTRQEVERQLGDGPWIYRARELREMGEGAFLLCGFWRIGHLIREGELDPAEALLEETTTAASPLGLYSEEIDPVSGTLLGNFPQGFSHLGLITTILDLQKAKEDPKFARLPDHEKFKAGVGRSIGARAVLAGFFRVPRTLRLLTSRRSKWR